jgi:hypothetical protein
VDHAEDVEKLTEISASTFEGTLRCRSSEVLNGLLHAKYKKLRLVIDEAAASLEGVYLNRGVGLVVIENNGTSDEVVAVNYAFSINADTILVRPVSQAEIRPVQRLIREWKKNGSTISYQQLREKVVERTEGVNFFDYEFATFFTLGLPYGLILNNMIPFTHVLINIICDLFVLNNIGMELARISQGGAALIFSPKLFQSEETEELVSILERNNFLVRAILGDKATVSALSNYGEHFPFDLLHICSHGGETDGYHVIQEFQDRTGTRHKVEYDEIVGFSPSVDGKVSVVRKALFRKFDGLNWGSDEIHKLPKYIFEDLRKALPANESNLKTTRRTKISVPIYASCHIECADSIHQGHFQALACNSNPIIFNNTCSSWYEITVTFVDSGSRAYIGTLWAVDNTVARAAAKTFYERLLKSQNLLDSFFEMTRAIEPPEYRSIYLYWGLHFSTLKAPVGPSDQEIFDDLVSYWNQWNGEYVAAGGPEAKRKCLEVLSFLGQELETNFGTFLAARHKGQFSKNLLQTRMTASSNQIADEPFKNRGAIDL